MHKNLTRGAWLLVLAWVLFAMTTWYMGRRTGFVISCTGLISTVFVVSAFYSRSRKRGYPVKKYS